jgi:hypothetical protein
MMNAVSHDNDNTRAETAAAPPAGRILCVDDEPSILSWVGPRLRAPRD